MEKRTGCGKINLKAKMKKNPLIFPVTAYLLFLLSSPITGEITGNDGKKDYLKCQEYLLEGNLKEALGLIRKALAVNPKDEMYIYLKENILGLQELKANYDNQIKKGKASISKGEELLRGDTEKSKSDGEILKYLGNKLIKRAPEEFADELKKRYDSYINAADKSYSEKQYEAAINNYLLANLARCSVSGLGEIKEIFKEDGQFEKEGDTCLKKKYYSKALEQYNEALRLNPGLKHIEGKIMYVEGIIKKSDELVTAGDEDERTYNYDKAIEKYEKALEITPGEDKIKIKIEQIKQVLIKYESLEESGDKHFKEKRYHAALEVYNQLLQEKPKLVNIKEKIARIEGKIALVEKIVKKIDHLVSAGDAYEWKRNFIEALKKYQEALELSPGNEKIIMKINKIEQTTKKYEEVGDKHFKEQKYDQALEVYKYLLQSNPTLIHIKEKIARTEDEIKKEKEKRFESAEGCLKNYDYTKAIEKYSELREISADKEEIDERIKNIKKLVEKEQLLEGFAEDYFKQGDYANALERYKQLLQLNPTLNRIKGRIAEIEEKMP